MYERLKSKELPENTYLVFSKNGLEILKNIHVAGYRFKLWNYYLSRDFTKIALEGIDLEKTAVVNILRSGPYYFVLEAIHDNYGIKVPEIKIGIKRKEKEGKFVAELYYKDNIKRGIKHLVTSEIIATGCTLEKAFEEILKEREIKTWTIFSVAAAKNGCSLLKELGEKYNVKVRLFLNCFVGGLGKNNTDIPFYHEETIILPEAKKELIKRYGRELYQKIKCSIGDGGNRFLEPKKHYEEILEVYSKLKLKEKKSKRALEEILNQTKDFLLSCYF